MKRRLLSALLALCMLTSLFPVALYSVAAVEEESQSSSAIFDYSSLYVGADGSTNENGGKLTLLLTSYLGDSSVSADKTIWNNIAPDATKHGTLYGTWSAMGKGGVGYDVANDSVLHCLRLDPSLLPVDTYSLEIVASVRGYTENAEGVTPAAFYSNTSNLWLGRLNAFLFSGTRVSDDRSHNGLVVVMNDTASLRGIHNYQQIASGDAFYNALQIYRHNTGVVNLGIDLTKSETHYSYAFFHNGAEALPSKNITSCAIDTANTEEVHDYFDLLRNMGATTYSVRLYTKPLTEAERRQNHFADVCAFYALDMSAFDAQADNNLLYIQFAKISLDEANYTATKAAAQEKLDAYADAFWYNALYVGADGSTNENGGKLTLLLTSYLGDSSVSEDKATWNNIAPGATKHGTLTGTWSTKGQGGIGYDVADDSLLHQLELDASLLPVDTYSLELIASVRGYTENADGATPAAFYSNTSNMWLGRLNAFLFSGEKTNDIRNNNGLVVVMNDTASLRGNHNYQQIASGDAFYNTVQAYRYNTSVVNFGITLTKSATHYNYQFLHHGSVCQPIGLKFAKGTSSCEIDAANTETAHDRFYLFRNMGATAYSIRLYTKPLTEAERRQNHFVDVSAFYCLDLKGFDVKADNSFLYAQFASVSLDEDNYETAKAAAQLMLDTYKDAFLYSSLYVGADGSKTENGGKLTVLLTSFKSESSVTADKKAWINIAPGAVQNANLSGTWQERGFGGIGFDQAGHSGSGITFDGTLLPIDTYTIEMIAAVRGYTVNGDGVSAPSQYIYSDPGMVLGRLRGFLFSGALTGTEDAGSYPLRENSVIMMMYDDVRNHDTWGGGKLTQWTNSLSVYRNNPDIVNLSISLTKSLTHYNYQFLGNGKAYKLPKQNACEIATDLDQENYHGNFILFRDMSPTVHSVRLYDKTLTDAEGAHNHFIDLMAYAGADMTAFNAAGAETQAFIVTAMRNVKYTEDAAELEAAIQEIILSFSHEWDPEKALYVTEGLTVLLSSYKGFSTGVIGEENLMWSNAVQKGTAGMLMGNGWHKSEDGGLRIRDTIPQSVADSNLVREYRNSTGQNNFYLSFDYSLLPKEDYTIESVMAPEGITVKDESGKVTRYYDDYTPNGLYSDNAMVFGPLRAICFSCYSHAANANMARRWMYQAGYSWDSPPPGGRVELGQDKALDNLAVGQIVNYSILHDYALDEEEMPTSNYNILYEGARVFTKLIEADKYISKSEVTDKQFTLWRGLAGTVYAVRVYDRVLTEDELLQNRVADICYYFDLDTTLLEKALEQIDDKATVFRAFTGLSFDMTKEEAQAALDYGMAGLWISHEGVGVKSNMTDAIRYYFNLQYSALAMMMQSGFSVEVGILLNVGSEQKPVLEKGAYGYRYVVFDSVAGTHTEYFLDEDTCAITLSYPGASADAYNKKINIQTYVRLTSKDNETMCFYGGLGDFAYTKDNSLFAVYSYMAEQESVIESEYNEYLEQVVDSCYTEEIVYFDSAAEGKGNGTKETPYTAFADAFAACKSILVERKTPTHVTLFVEGGTHFIGDVAELDFDEISFKANTFTIEGDFLADEPPTLTTTVEISVSDFEAVEGKEGLYVYQFTADSEGKFPAFRDFYVNGFTADLAHSTPTTTANGEFPYILRFDRDYSGTFLKAEYYYNEGTLLDHAPEVEFASSPERTDLIESYTTHYTYFLALYELKAKYNDSAVSSDDFKALTAQTLHPNCDGTYKTAFATFHASLCDAKDGKIKAEAVTYTYAKPMESHLRPGVVYVNVEVVEFLRDTVKARTEALKAAGTYEPTSSYKTILSGMQAEMIFMPEWHYDIMDVAGIDFEDVVYYKIPEGPNGYKGTVETAVAVYLDEEQYKKFTAPGGYSIAGTHVALQNAMEFVDENNEYYYDLTAGRLYYFNENGIDDTTFAYPTLDNMFIFHNARNLTVSDLTIWGIDNYILSEVGFAATQAGGNLLGSTLLRQTGFSSRGALVFFNAKDVTVEDCYIHDIGGTAIFMEGRTENISILGNEIESIGEGGIRLCGHRDDYGEFSERSGAENVTIFNNYLYGIAQQIYNIPAIHLTACKDVEIAQNTVIGCSYSAFSLGWKWVKADWEEGEGYNIYNANIHHNYVTDFMQNMGDGGAFYVVGGNLKRDNPKLVNYIHHNYVVLSQYTGNGLGRLCSAYYFDGASSNWDCYENIAVNYSAGADRGASANASYKDYTMYVRRTQNHYIFNIQWVNDIAYAYHVRVKGNHVFNVRASSAKNQELECYKSEGGRVPAKDRGVFITDAYYYAGADKLSIPGTVKALIEETGSYMRPGEWEWLLSNEY